MRISGRHWHEARNAGLKKIPPGPLMSRMRLEYHARAKGFGLDLVKLRDKIGEQVVMDYLEVAVERRTQPVQIVLREETHGNYSFVGHARAPCILNDDGRHWVHRHRGA
jgi:hypothetical protein